MSFDVLKKLIFILLTCIFFCIPVLSADNLIIITADRINSQTSKSSSDVRIITSAEIAQTSSKSLSELLSKESDLYVANSGQNGSNASLFLRGTDSSHTLFVINGITMNDPSNPNRQFDIGRLSLNNIERIEILKGSQGLLYGSNAIGGVVVITTKSAQSKNISGNSSLEYGTFNTVNMASNFQKKLTDYLGVSLGLDFLKTDGFSAANVSSNPNAEKDGNQRITLDAGVNADLSEAYSIDTNLRYVHNKTDIDKGGGAGNDDPNDQQKEEEIYSKFQVTKNWDSGNALSKFSYNFSKHFRLLDVRFDTKNPNSSRSINTGDIKTISANHTYYINDKLTQNFNIDFQEEEDQSHHYNQNTSGFIYHQYELNSSIFNFGLRVDHNNYFKDHFTYKLASGHQFESALLKLSYSTGFRAPSLNQLYDSTYGFKDLIPETSQSTDLSLEKKILGSVKTISTLFYTKIDNRFDYNPNTFVNINSGTAEIVGLEQKMTKEWDSSLTHSLAFTLLKTHDLKKNKKLARRPDANIKNLFTYHFGNVHNIGFESSYIGKRNDVDNSGNSVMMNSYLVSQLNYQYVMGTNNEFYLKIKNIFNDDYEEIYGFGNGRRSISIGARYNY